MEPGRGIGRSGVAVKLALLGLIPVLVLLGGALRVGADGTQEIAALEAYGHSVRIAVAAGELRGRLQAERALSTGRVGQGRPADGDEALADARRGSVQALASFDELVARSAPGATARIRERAAAAGGDDLRVLRARIDAGEIGAAELREAFGARIERLDQLVDVLSEEIPVPELINGTLAYSAISSVLAPAWQERPIVAGALAAGARGDGLDPARQNEIQSLVAAQKTFARAFERTATGEPRSAFAGLSQDSAMIEVDQMRAQALAAGAGAGEASVASWLAASTTRIDDLAFVQRLQGAHLEAAVDREIAGARRELVIGLGLLSLALVVLLIGSALLARSISRPLGRVAAEARRVAEGRIPRRLPAPTRDEIGDVTAAFSRLNETIDLMTAESARVLAAVQSGDKSARADESAFTGFWAAMPAGVNRILDEFGALGGRLESEARRQRLLAEASALALDLESGSALHAQIVALVHEGLAGERATLLSGSEPGGRSCEVLGTAGRGWIAAPGVPHEEWREHAYRPGAVAVDPLAGHGHAALAHVPMGDGGDAYLYVERAGEAFSAEEFGFLSTAASLLAQAEARTGAEDRLRRQSINDELTDLPNRAFFEEYLRQLEPVPGDRRGHAIILLDIDRFQQVNETLGYGVGDELLREVARRLDDQIPPGALIARHGSDEFIVHIDGREGSIDPRRVALALIGCFEESIWANGNSLRLAASAGFAEGTALDAAAGRITSNADTALRLAKGRAGSAVERFQEGHHAEVVRRSWLEAALWEFVNRDEMEVHFQPIVDAPDGRVVAVEALARWPGREDVPPAEFIPVAEEIGLIGRLDAIVRERAVRWAAGSAGVDAPDISFNVSPVHLADPELPSSIASLIADSGIAPGRVCLEITESAVLGEEETTLGALRALRDLGVKLVVDDFGTGYSSFAYLTRLPIDGLKIDRAFITEAESPDQLTVLSSIISLCGDLGLTVTAEGVESERQRERLSRMGCDRIQGFLVAHPCEPSALDLDDRPPVVALPSGD